MRRLIALGLLTALLLTGGCTAGGEGSGQTAQPTADAAQASDAAQTMTAGEIDATFSAGDLDVGYDEATATKIELNGSQVSLSGSGASYADGVVTISAAGTYLITGTLDDGQLVVSVPDTDKVRLVLRDASITCQDHAALYIKQADKVFVTLAEGSENRLASGAIYNLDDEDANVDGAVFSRADLTFNGSGKLVVIGEYKHAVVSKDDLVLAGGTYEIQAAYGGLYGKDCVKIADGDYTIQTGTDGIQASNGEDEGRGYVYIAGGVFHITAGTDAVQAETVLLVEDGEFTLETGGGSANASTDSQGNVQEEWGRWGPGQAQEATEQDNDADTSDSAKGLKAGSDLTLRGGAFTIDSSDDAIHSNGTLTVAGGTYTIQTGDDGIHADDALNVSGGEIDLQKSYEGLEGLSVTISAGKIQIVASDDGINAAGGSDTAQTGRPGQNAFRSAANDEIFVRITGGNLTVDASGDGLDSNANLYIDGGSVYISGPTNDGNSALDYDGEAQITGGLVVATGMSGMAQGFSENSGQCSVLHSFSANLAAGDTVTLTDAQGEVLATYTPPKAYQCVIVSCPEMTQGETYTLTAGEQSASLTLSAVVTSNGGLGGGMGGDRGGNIGNEPPGGGGRGGR